MPVQGGNQSGVSAGDSVTQTSTDTTIGGGASVGAGSTVVGAGGAIESGQINATGANLSGASSDTPFFIGTGATVGNISVTQASPQDVALAAQAFQDSLAIVQGSEMASLGLANEATQRAQDAIANASPFNSKVAIGLGVLAAVVIGLYIWKGRK